MLTTQTPAYPARKKSQRSRIFIDLGALAGDTIRSALKWYPRFTCYYAFEPLSENYAQLQEELAGVNRVVLINAAADVTDGEAPLFFGSSPGRSGGSLCDKSNCSKDQYETVKTVAFSSFLRQHVSPGDRVVLKMDIEGKEYDVLEDLIRTGAIDLVTDIFCEWHYDRLQDCKQRHVDLVQSLNHHGFGLTGNNREDEFHWVVKNWEKYGRIRCLATTDWRRFKLRMKYRHPTAFSTVSSLINVGRGKPKSPDTDGASAVGPRPGAAQAHPAAGPKDANGESDVPLVSVIIPLLNCQSSVEAALDSILATGWPRIEILVVDDGSTDGGPDVVLAYAKSHAGAVIQLLRHPDRGNHGIAASRNLAASVARGAYLSFLDADDVYMPARFHAAINRLEADKGLGAVYSLFEYEFPESDSSSRVQKISAAVAAVRSAPAESATGDIFEEVLRGTVSLCVNTVTFRTETFRKLEGFPNIRHSQDKGLWLRLFATERVEAVGDSPVSKYLIHDASWCSQRKTSPEYLLGPVMARLDAIRWLRKNGASTEILERLKQALVAKLFYKATVGRQESHSVRVAYLRLMRQVAWEAPAVLFSRRYWGTLARVALSTVRQDQKAAHGK